jgi:DNA-binding MarR family transcriptional regulator
MRKPTQRRNGADRQSGSPSRVEPLGQVPKSDSEDGLPSGAQLIDLARRLGKARQLRHHFLPNELFSELAWEMLIALFLADAEGRRCTVTNLCEVSGGPPTTALRWIDSLIQLELARRLENPLDARFVFIELEPEGRAAMEAYLSQTWSLLYGSH